MHCSCRPNSSNPFSGLVGPSRNIEPRESRLRLIPFLWLRRAEYVALENASDAFSADGTPHLVHRTESLEHILTTHARA